MKIVHRLKYRRLSGIKIRGWIFWRTRKPDGGFDPKENSVVSPTAGAHQRFNEYYRCYHVAILPDPNREHINHGGKVFMPPSALEKFPRLRVVIFLLSAQKAAMVYPIFDHVLALPKPFHGEVGGSADHMPMGMRGSHCSALRPLA